MARPTKYSKALQKKADKYIDSLELYSKKKITKIIKGEVVEIEIDQPNTIPSVEGLALLLGVTRQTIYNWAEIHDQFFDTLEKIKLKQKIMINHHASIGNYDSSFSRFLAINVTDYVDRKEIKQENTGSIEINIDKEDSEL